MSGQTTGGRWNPFSYMVFLFGEPGERFVTFLREIKTDLTDLKAGQSTMMERINSMSVEMEAALARTEAVVAEAETVVDGAGALIDGLQDANKALSDEVAALLNNAGVDAAPIVAKLDEWNSRLGAAKGRLQNAMLENVPAVADETPVPTPVLNETPAQPTE